MAFTVPRKIGAEHPSLPGHFPGAPIVPAVVILDEIVTALGEWRAQSQLAVIRAVKFLMPLKPDQLFTIYFSPAENSENKVNFCCRVEGRLIVEGRLELHSSSG